MLLSRWTADLVSQQLDELRDPWTTLLFANLQQLQPNSLGNYIVIYRRLKCIDQELPVQKTLAVECFRWIISASRSLHWTELQTALALSDSIQPGDLQSFENDFSTQIRRVCGNLVCFIRENGAHLWGHQKATFVHPSIFEFFVNQPQLLRSIGDAWEILSDTRAMHRRNALDCINLLRSKLDTLSQERPLAYQIDYTSFNYYAINHFDKHLVAAESLSEPPSEPMILLQQMLNQGREYLLRFLLMRLYLSPYIGGGLRHISPADVNFEAFPQFIIWSTDLYKIRAKFQSHMEMSLGRLLRALVRAGLLVAVKNLIQEEYLENLEHDIDEIENEESALYIACESGHVDIVQELLAAGACPQPEAITPLCWIDCETPLFRAILNGHTSVVGLLLNAGVDVNVPTDLYSWYTYPLQLAEIHEHHDIVKLLIEYGADRSLFAKTHNSIFLEDD